MTTTPLSADPLPQIPPSHYLATLIADLLIDGERSILDEPLADRVAAKQRAKQAARVIATFCSPAALRCSRCERTEEACARLGCVPASLATAAAPERGAEDTGGATCANGGWHSSREWAWLDEMVRAGRGVVSFCETEDGDVGVYWTWRHKGERSVGSGNTVEDAVQSAMRKIPSVEEAARVSE